MTSRSGSSVWSLFRGGPQELVTPPRATIAGLDVLRSLAVVLVLSGHVAVDYADRHGSFLLEKLPLFTFGWTGVDLFFVLSGYLIGKQLWRELDRSNAIDVPAFLVRRGLRIWPLYFFFVALLALVLHPERPFARAFPDLFFVSNYVPGIVAGGWSLSTEEQFYIVTPILLLMTRKVPFDRKWVVLASLFVLMPILRFVELQLWLRDGGSQDLPMTLLYTPIHTHADGLLLGLFFAWLAVVRPTAVAPCSMRVNWRAPFAMLVAGALLRKFDKHVFAYTGLALAYGGMTLFMLRDQSWISRMSSWTGFHTISRLSYGMYLNHFFVLPLAFDHLDEPGTGFVPARFALVYGGTLVLSILAAAVTFCLVEHPFLVMRERWLEARRKTTLERAA